MNKKMLGYMIIAVSIIFLIIMIFNSETLSPKINIIGVDGIITSKAIMIACLCLIFSKIGFYLINDD